MIDTNPDRESSGLRWRCVGHSLVENIIISLQAVRHKERAVAPFHVDDPEDLPSSDFGEVIERGETYNHAEDGPVEVTRIWKGVEAVDSAHHTNEKDVIIVRYSTEKDGERISGLTDTLDDFLAAIED